MLSEPQRLTFTLPNFGQPESPHRVVCHQWGNENAPRTVFCVHGLTRNGRDFDLLAQALAADTRVICPDMPGRGESEWLTDTKGYSYPAYAADILAIADQLHLTHIDWVGTSMGGIIGMMVAAMRPGLIRALVLNDIGAIVSAAGLRRIMDYAGTKPVFATREEAEAALRIRCAPYGITDETQWQQLFSHSFQQDAKGWRFAYDPAISAGVTKDSIANDIDLWAFWEAVSKIPLLVVRGAESDILTRETALQMQARHPNLRLHEVPATGHAPALMAADQIALVRDWLQSVTH